MANRSFYKTTFEAEHIIQPIYTGGSVALDQSGRILATTLTEDVLLTDLQSGVELARIEGDGEVVNSICLTPSATHLIICSRSLSMRIFSLKPSLSGTSTISVSLLRTLKPHTAPVITTATDSTGTLLATGGADGLVKVWDIRGGYVTHTFKGHSGLISALRFFEISTSSNADNRNGISAKSRRKDSDGDNEMRDADGEKNSVSRSFRLASGGEDGKIRIWDLRKRAITSVLDSHTSVVTALDFSSDMHALVSASRDKTITIWDAKSWKSKRTIPVLEGIEAASFTEGGEYIITGGEKGRVRVWMGESGREITEDQQAGNESEGIVAIISQKGLSFIVAIHADQSLVLHSIESIATPSPGSKIPPLPVLRHISGTHDEIIDLAYLAPNRSLLALATNSEDLRIVSLRTNETTTSSENAYFGSDVALLKGHEEIIICLDVDWSGHWIATGAKDNIAKLWRCDPANNSWTCYATLTGHAESIGAISLPQTAPPTDSAEYLNPLDHPPKFLLTGSQDRTIKRWNISTSRDKSSVKNSFKAAYTRKAHDKDINALHMNHTLTLAASASQDRTAKIWSIEEGEVQGILRGHRRGVWSIKFSPKDTPNITAESGSAASASRGFVLTGSGDKTVKIWSLSDYSCLRTFEGHTNSVLKVVWLNRPTSETRDKKAVQVASAGGDGLLKVWDATTGEVETTLDNHTDRIWALACHPETNDLISGGGDSIVTFWTNTTTQTAVATREAQTALVEKEQTLQNHIHAGSYREAIVLALQLNHPARLLSLFKSVVETSPPEIGSLSGLLAVDEVLANLDNEQLFSLLLRIRDWNTNARTAPVAQRLLWTIVKSYPASQLAELRTRGGKGGSLKEVFEALRRYTERHYRRVEELVDESWLVEFTLREMDQVGVS